MESVLEALLITLGLDASGVTKGSKEVDESLKKTSEQATKAQKEMDEAAKRIAEGFTKVRNTILEVGAAIISAVAGKEVVAYLTQTDAAISRTARNVNMSSQDMSAWQGAAERSGGSAEGMAGSIQNLSGELQKMALTGKSDIIPFLTAAHMNLNKFFNAATPMGERLKMIADAMKNMDPARAQSLGAGMRLDEGTINTLMIGRDALDALLERMQKIRVLSKEDSDAAIDRKNAWSDLADTLVTLARHITTEITPALTGLLKAMQSLVQFLSEHMPTTNGLLGGMVSVMGLLVGYKLNVWAAGWAGAMGTVGAAAATLLGRLGLLGAALSSGYLLGSGLDWLISKGLTAATGKETDLGGWIFDRFDKSDYTSGNPHVYGKSGGAAASGGASNWDSLIQGAATKWGVPAELIRAVIQQESRGNPNAVGPLLKDGTHAQGLMQLIPGTAGNMGVANSFDPAQNVDGGTHYLHDLLSKYGGNTEMALAAYNWGPGNLDKFGFGRRPSETRGYINSIVGGMNASRGGGGGSTTTVSVGEVHVHTNSSNAPAIAQDIRRELNTTLATQANTGLQ